MRYETISKRRKEIDVCTLGVNVNDPEEWRRQKKGTLLGHHIQHFSKSPAQDPRSSNIGIYSRG